MSALPNSSLLVRTATAAATPIRSLIPSTPGRADVAGRLRAAEAAAHRWLVAYSLSVLRLSVGVVFLAFGVLKFFPGVSPAQNLVEATTHILTLGLVPGAVALVGVAVLETTIGLCLLTGRGLRAAVHLLVLQLAGILSPLVLLPGRLFSGAHHAPTLEGQYVIKDLIIVGAALVLAATIDGARLTSDRESR